MLEVIIWWAMSQIYPKDLLHLTHCFKIRTVYIKSEVTASSDKCNNLTTPSIPMWCEGLDLTYGMSSLIGSHHSLVITPGQYLVTISICVCDLCLHGIWTWL